MGARGNQAETGVVMSLHVSVGISQSLVLRTKKVVPLLNTQYTHIMLILKYNEVNRSTYKNLQN